MADAHGSGPASGPPFSVTLEGASNVRDLGGYRGAGGRVVRRGLLFRSAALARLTPADQEAMAALGLRTICDFRGRDERDRAPTALTGPANLSLPIEPTVGAGLRDILATKEATGEALQAVLQRAYVAYALESQAQYAALFAQVLSGGLPLLFHCSAGKDRTGFGAALLLSALDVSWPDIQADFEATNRLWRRDTVANDDLPPAIRESLLRAEPVLLKAAFTALHDRYGSLDAYLAEALGVDAGKRALLQDTLLETPQ